MIFFNKYLIILVLLFFSISCTEKISYSGKILNTGEFNIENLSYKKEILSKLGQPDYIDPIENKFYYFSEQKNTKNFFNQKIINRKMTVLNFDENQKIISIANYDLNDEKDLKFIQEKTPNNLLKKGLIEKIFGGVGNSIPSTTE